MNFLTPLFLLGLMVTGFGAFPCSNDCMHTNRHHKQQFMHISEFQNSSVAPWKLVENTVTGREPYAITHAVCNVCTVKGMVAKPIYLKISVYQMVRIGMEGNIANVTWCKCPYKLAVGCTCVMKQ